MEDFIKNVISSNRITPPESCLQSFEQNFSGAINIDWSEKDGKFEAIFYKDQIEHIAIFETDGTLEKYKMHLNRDLLPVSIQRELEKAREIMSVVLINEGNTIWYEVIVRDQALIRYLLRVTQLGKVLSESKL